MLGARLLGPRKEEAWDRYYPSLRPYRSRRHASLWAQCSPPPLATAAAASRSSDRTPGAGAVQGGEPRDREPREWPCPALQPGVCSGTTIPADPRGPWVDTPPTDTGWTLLLFFAVPGL